MIHAGDSVRLNGETYHLEAVLSSGRNSYGEVWRAQASTGERVALKFVRFGHGDRVREALLRAHYEREVLFLRSATARRHPNIVRMRDAGEIAFAEGVTRQVLVLELMDRSLLDAMQDRGPGGARPPLRRLLHVAMQIAEGLRAVHEAGLLYRDLKADNVLLTPADATGHWTAKLADFGTLRTHDPLRLGSFAGSLSTMAPEQAIAATVEIVIKDGQELAEPRYRVDAQADWYAFGLLLYRMITSDPSTQTQREMEAARLAHGDIGLMAYAGRFGGLTGAERERLRAALGVDTESVPVHEASGTFLPATPDSPPVDGPLARLAALVERLLAPEPGDRHGDAVAIRAVLAAALENCPQPEMPAVSDRVRGDAPEPPVWARVALALMLAISGAWAGQHWFWPVSEDRRAVVVKQDDAPAIEAEIVVAEPSLPPPAVLPRPEPASSAATLSEPVPPPVVSGAAPVERAPASPAAVLPPALVEAPTVAVPDAVPVTEATATSSVPLAKAPPTPKPAPTPKPTPKPTPTSVPPLQPLPREARPSPPGEDEHPATVLPVPAVADPPGVGIANTPMPVQAATPAVPEAALSTPMTWQGPDGIELVRLRGGDIEMGDSNGDPDEQPVHTRRVAPFYLARTEVTWGQFRAFCRERPLPLCTDAAAQADAMPVSGIDWHEAQAFVAWLRERTGQPYALPSEAQFAWALRNAGAEGDAGAANLADRTFLARQAQPPRRALFADRDDGHAGVAPVASYPADRLGLFDLNGNLSEWTADCAHHDYRDAPAGDAAWLDAADCAYAIARGASYFSGPREARLSNRLPLAKASRVATLGFRVALPITRPERER